MSWVGPHLCLGAPEAVGFKLASDLWFGLLTIASCVPVALMLGASTHRNKEVSSVNSKKRKSGIKKPLWGWEYKLVFHESIHASPKMLPERC